MRTICLYFQVHQPFRLKRYRFFEIGHDHNYYDEYANYSILRKIADKCYLPANQIIYDLIQKHGKKFKITFSLSGSVIDQFEKYTPDVLESFKRLAKTGCVEFLSETYAHSLSSLKSKTEFFEQVHAHAEKIKQHFGSTPTAFRNTELVYSDYIGEMVSELGFKVMLTEGAKHVLGWKSPNYMYYSANNKKLKMLLKNFRLSDDIAFRFSNKAWEGWPLTAEKFVDWLNIADPKEEVINLFMDYETFGEHQWAESGIFEFLKSFPDTVFKNSDFTFHTPSELADLMQPVAPIHVPYPISWADEERDLTAWLGNELQDEAFENLYNLEPIVKKCNDPALLKDWTYLQASDHFYYMCTKFFSDGDVHSYFNPYDSPYDAFINYMNVLSDFTIRLKKAAENSLGDMTPDSPEEIASLIDKYQLEIQKLKEKMESKKTKAIDKTKKQPAAIDKTKKQPVPIDITKKEPEKLMPHSEDKKKPAQKKEAKPSTPKPKKKKE